MPVTNVNVRRVRSTIVRVESMEKEEEGMGRVIAMEKWKESIAVVTIASVRMDMD